MQKFAAGEPETQSADLVSENVARLRELFPEAFTEGKVDFDVLKQLMGGEIDEREEKYGLNWHGKRRARQIALTPSTGTLLPCPEESVDWDTTQNLMIEGDNLEVLKLLQKSYAGKVKLIYIDPPYNTGRDFVYPDDFSDSIRNYLEITGQTNGDGQKLSSNTETSGRYHTDWLNMMLPRLKLSRQLLREDGVVLVSIDEHEFTNLAFLLNEVFGEENAITVITWEKGRKNDSNFFSESVEYVLVYGRDREVLRKKGVWREKKPRVDEVLEHYRKLRESIGENHSEITDAMMDFFRSLDRNDPAKKLSHFHYSDNRGLYFRDNISSASTSIPDYDVIHPVTGVPCKKPDRGWGCTQPVMLRRIAEDRVHFGDDHTTGPNKKTYLEEVDAICKTPVIYKDGRAATRMLRSMFDASVFENPKDHEVLADLFAYVADKDAIILDFFAGSCSTAHAATMLNLADGGARRFITVQLPEQTADDSAARSNGFESIADIGKERMRRVMSQASSQVDVQSLFGKNLDLGFRVFKLAESNIRAWDPDRDDLAGTLLEAVEHIRPDRSELDVLYELLLKLGLDLTVPIEQRQIAGKTVHNIGAGSLYVCLDTAVSRDEVEPLAHGIAAWHKSVAVSGEPTLVFRDSAFADDVVKTNLTAILKQHGLEHVRSL